MPNTTEIIRAAAAGDSRAQRSLLAKFAPQIKTAAHRVLNDPETPHPSDAFDDLVAVGNAAMLLEAVPSYDPDRSPFGAWAYVVATRAMLKEVRRLMPADQRYVGGRFERLALDQSGLYGHKQNDGAFYSSPREPWTLADALSQAEEAGLTQREVQVLWACRCGDPQTVTADRLRVSKGRISQLLMSGLRKLRDFFADGREPGGGDPEAFDFDRALSMWKRGITCEDPAEFAERASRVPDRWRFLLSVLFPRSASRQPSREDPARACRSAA